MIYYILIKIEFFYSIRIASCLTMATDTKTGDAKTTDTKDGTQNGDAKDGDAKDMVRREITFKCYVCDNPGTKRCSRCVLAMYCSLECQQQHYSEHKLNC